MITVQNISKIFGGEYLFNNINFTINENDKLAILGKNGVRKSTLLKIIENDEIATDGTVIKGNHTIAVLSQEKQLNPENTVSDEMNEIKHQYDQIQKQMEQLVNDPNFATDLKLIERYGHLENRYDQMGGYEIDSKIQKIFAIFDLTKMFIKSKLIHFQGEKRHV